jgi:hypothetical protein
VDFQCSTVAEVYHELAEFCRGLRRDVAMECNPTGIWGENSAYMRSVDHARLLPAGQFFWDESPNPYGLLRNGALSTNIRSMKLGQTLGNRTFYYSHHGGDHAAQIRAAEGLAFNGGCLGRIVDLDGDRPLSPEALQPYVRLLNRRPEWFVGTRSMARVAVYRHFASLAFNSLDPHLQAILAEQTLLQHHVAFDLACSLREIRHRALIVPGMECLSSEEIDAMRSFARSGGQVLLIGSAGHYDEWRRERPACPFGLRDGPSAARRIGRGSIRRLPALRLPAGGPALDDRAVWDTWYRVVDARFWRLPANAPVLLRALGRRSGGTCLLDVNAPATTVVEPRLTADGASVVIHIINYHKPATNRPLRFRLSDCAPPSRVMLINPHDAEPLAVRCAQTSGGLRFAVPNRNVYSVVVLEQTRIL